MPCARRLRHRWALPLLAAAGLQQGCGPGHGPPVDWSLGARVAQSIEADMNRGLENPEEGALLTAALDAGLVLDAATKRALFSADIGIASAYSGGDDSELAGTGRVDPRIALAASYRGKTWSVGANASLAVQRVSDTGFGDTGFGEDGLVEGGIDEGGIGAGELVDAGLVDRDGTLISTQLGTTLKAQLTPLTEASFGLSARILEYTNTQTLTPTRTLGATTGLAMDLTETTRGTLTLGVRDFASDDTEGTRSQTLDLSAGITHRRTPRHTIRLQLGTTGVRTVEEIAGGTPVFDVGATGGFGFTYRLQRFSAGFDLKQSVDPSSVGDLQAFSRLSGLLDYRITEDQSLGLRLDISRRTPLSGGEDTLTSLGFGPTYSLALDAETALSLGYLFRLSNEAATGTTMGHRVQLTLSRDLAILD